MKAQELMRVEVHTITPEIPLEQAHKWMLRLGIRHLPVVSAHQLVGMVSDRDILLRIGQNKEGDFLYPPLTAGDVMTLMPKIASPKTPISELAQTMVQEKLDALPICQNDNAFVGLVTSSDLLLLLTEFEPAPPKMAYHVRSLESLPVQA